jgi:hypothetical protein
MSLTGRLTSGVVFLRVRSWEVGERVRRWVMRYFSNLSRPQRIVFRVAVTTCLAVWFAYSWTHSGRPEYASSGRRIIPLTPLIGMVLAASLISLLWELSGKE